MGRLLLIVVLIVLELMGCATTVARGGDVAPTVAADHR
jgi:hypothetical protein